MTRPVYATSLVYQKGGTSSQPLYVANKYPCYQIDFSSAATGKNIAATKRRVRWRFGFASPAALDSGATGVDCRGEEHEVVLVWSISSGKRLLMVDGQEVHYSYNSKESKFQFAWTLRGNHTAKVTAYSMAAVFGNKKGWKQFDFSLDGLSYFDFVKIYELGLTRHGGAGDRGDALVAGTTSYSEQNQNYNNYTLDDVPAQQPRSNNFAHSQDYHYNEPDFAVSNAKQYEEELRRLPTTNHSQQEEYKPSQISYTNDVETRSMPTPPAPLQQQPPPPAPVEEKKDLLDFAFETTTNLPTNVLDYSNGYSQQSNYSPQNDFGGMNAMASDPYANPVHPPPPQPSVPYNNYANNVMHAYNINPPVPPQDAQIPSYNNPNQYPTTTAPPINHVSYNGYQQSAANPEKPLQISDHPANSNTHTYNLGSIDDDDYEDVNSRAADDISRGMKKLVNLEDITQPADKEPTKLTMNPVSEKKQDKKSRGLPPTQTYTFGAQPSLGEIQSIRHKEPPKKEVMRASMAPPVGVQPGAVVVYGAAMPPQYASGYNAGYNNARYY